MGLQFPKVPESAKSRYDERRDKATAKAENWRKVCKQVDRRDNHRCRACSSACNADSPDLLARGHRHHVTFRSKGGQDVASNLITLCARCHDALHVKRTLRIELTTAYGADGACVFWRTSPDGEEFIARRELSVGQVERD